MKGIKGRVTIRCPDCRAWHPFDRQKCEGYDRRREQATGCGFSFKGSAREYWIEFYLDGRRKRERVGLSSGPGPANLMLAKRQMEIDEGRYKPQRKSLNFSEIAENCYRQHLSAKKTAREYRRLLNVEVLPILGGLSCQQITRSDILTLLEAIENRGSPVTANRVLSLLKIVFNWAFERDLIETSPVGRVKPLSTEKSRDIVLTDTEIATFWHGIAHAGVGEAVQGALRFILVTGQRPGEVASAKLQDMDLARGASRWTMPDTKGNRSHPVPLSSLALEIVFSQRKSEQQEYLFTTRNGKPLNGSTLPHAVKRISSLLEMNFTPHDLRRTVGTKLAEMGVSHYTISRILNHTEGGVTRIYNRYSYDKEKREALDLWAARLREITETPLSNQALQ
jgi:integrase